MLLLKQNLRLNYSDFYQYWKMKKPCSLIAAVKIMTVWCIECIVMALFQRLIPQDEAHSLYLSLVALVYNKPTGIFAFLRLDAYTYAVNLPVIRIEIADNDETCFFPLRYGPLCLSNLHTVTHCTRVLSLNCRAWKFHYFELNSNNKKNWNIVTRFRYKFNSFQFIYVWAYIRPNRQNTRIRLAVYVPRIYMCATAERVDACDE